MASGQEPSDFASEHESSTRRYSVLLGQGFPPEQATRRDRDAQPSTGASPARGGQGVGVTSDPGQGTRISDLVSAGIWRTGDPLPNSGANVPNVMLFALRGAVFGWQESSRRHGDDVEDLETHYSESRTPTLFLKGYCFLNVLLSLGLMAKLSIFASSPSLSSQLLPALLLVIVNRLQTLSFDLAQMLVPACVKRLEIYFACSGYASVIALLAWLSLQSHGLQQGMEALTAALSIEPSPQIVGAFIAWVIVRGLPPPWQWVDCTFWLAVGELYVYSTAPGRFSANRAAHCGWTSAQCLSGWLIMALMAITAVTFVSVWDFQQRLWFLFTHDSLRLAAQQRTATGRTMQAGVVGVAGAAGPLARPAAGSLPHHADSHYVAAAGSGTSASAAQAGRIHAEPLYRSTQEALAPIVLQATSPLASMLQPALALPASPPPPPLVSPPRAPLQAIEAQAPRGQIGGFVFASAHHSGHEGSAPGTILGNAGAAPQSADQRLPDNTPSPSAAGSTREAAQDLAPEFPRSLSELAVDLHDLLEAFRNTDQERDDGVAFPLYQSSFTHIVAQAKLVPPQSSGNNAPVESVDVNILQNLVEDVVRDAITSSEAAPVVLHSTAVSYPGCRRVIVHSMAAKADVSLGASLAGRGKQHFRFEGPLPGSSASLTEPAGCSRVCASGQSGDEDGSDGGISTVDAADDLAGVAPVHICPPCTQFTAEDHCVKAATCGLELTPDNDLARRQHQPGGAAGTTAARRKDTSSSKDACKALLMHHRCGTGATPIWRDPRPFAIPACAFRPLLQLPLQAAALGRLSVAFSMFLNGALPLDVLVEDTELCASPSISAVALGGVPLVLCSTAVAAQDPEPVLSLTGRLAGIGAGTGTCTTNWHRSSSFALRVVVSFPGSTVPLVDATLEAAELQQLPTGGGGHCQLPLSGLIAAALCKGGVNGLMRSPLLLVSLLTLRGSHARPHGAPRGERLAACVPVLVLPDPLLCCELRQLFAVLAAAHGRDHPGQLLASLHSFSWEMAMALAPNLIAHGASPAGVPSPHVHLLLLRRLLPFLLKYKRPWCLLQVVQSWCGTAAAGVSGAPQVDYAGV